MAFSLTIAPVQNRAQNVAGIRRRSLYRITFSGADTYVTGGVGLTPNQFSLGQIEAIIPCGLARSGTAAVAATWDETNLKLMLFQSTTGAPAALLEVAAAQSIANYALVVEVLGF